MLNSMNITGIVAENGIIAVDQFNAFMREGYIDYILMCFSILFEMILMDIIMPEMGGYAATEMIRKSEINYALSESEKHFVCGFSAHVNPGMVLIDLLITL